MKGVILAGGKGTRLHPLTKVTNKHLLPVGREPMLYHPIRQLVEANVTETLIVTSPEHMGDVVECLGSGETLGCDLTYRVQEAAGGIAHALALAERFAGGDRLAVMLGDNVFELPIAPYAERFRGGMRFGARIVLAEVKDPGRYGVATVDGPRVVSIEEKPADPKSSYAVTGLYFYDRDVFEIIRGLSPSARGELEITDVNMAYLKKGRLGFDICAGRWTDAGTFESYREANELLWGAL
jgi:glucose-1-phosphate thymidylyltransferase